MIGTLLETVSPQVTNTTSLTSIQASSLKPVRNVSSCPFTSVPLSFECLGGKWKGQIQLLKTGFLEFHLEGLPPVLIGQELQFQCLQNPSDQNSQIYTGNIHLRQIQRGVSVWDATTILLVEPCGLSQNILHLGSFVRSRPSVEQPEPFSENSIGFNQSESPDVSLQKVLNVPRENYFSNGAQIKSSRVSFQNISGQVISAFHDYPVDHDMATLPVVVLAPGYGETKRDYLTLSYFFVSNGFQVIRYDHTNHVGESEGIHFDITLSSMKEDFQAVVRNARQRWPQSPVIGVASSLAARVALKAEANDPSLTLLVLLMGIVDIQQSVATVHLEDVFANYLKGHIQNWANILGFNVAKQFLCDALSNEYSTLETTIQDIQSLETPLMYVSAGKDAWIDKTALLKFKHSLDSNNTQWIEVPEALHRIQENPKIARMTYRHIIQHCHEQLGLSVRFSGIQEPDRVDLGRQNRQEKIAFQRQSFTKVGKAFWSDYLGNFQTVGACQDYVQLLDHVFHALGPITPGQRLLDAGCGNGNAGLFFLQSLLTRQNPSQQISDTPIDYIGIDVVQEALGRAQCQMSAAYRSLQESCAHGVAPIRMSWSQVDLGHSLPFKDNQFDQIISNLVLGYMPDPQAVLQELFRVLAPGGRMVISNLKPNGDFSEIYQNLVAHAGSNNQKTEARELLNNYGKIRQAEKEGQFRFFDQTEWQSTLDTLKCVHSGIYPTFANQAYLIVLQKSEIPTDHFLSPTFKEGLGIQLHPECSPSLKAAA